MKVKLMDVLLPGSIWKTKNKGVPIMVLGVSNMDMNKDSYPVTVIFRYGQDKLISCDIKTFKSNMLYVRQDNTAKNVLLDAFLYDEDKEKAKNAQTENKEEAEDEDSADSVSYSLQLTRRNNAMPVAVDEKVLDENLMYYNEHIADNGNTIFVTLGFTSDDKAITPSKIYTSFAPSDNGNYYTDMKLVINGVNVDLQYAELVDVYPSIILGCTMVNAVFVMYQEDEQEDEQDSVDVSFENKMEQLVQPSSMPVDDAVIVQDIPAETNVGETPAVQASAEPKPQESTPAQETPADTETKEQ